MISVVIPCYNQGRFLTECLESLVAQTLPPGEVIVVNDGSNDRPTNDLCARLPHYDYPFPLRVIAQPNRGLAGARNTGIRAASGEIILPLDADDRLHPTALEEFERFLAARPDVDVCYPDMILFGNTRHHHVAFRCNRWRLTQMNLMPPASAVRRRVFDAGYYYCEELRLGLEDWEFYMRCCALGPFRAEPLGKPVFLYRKWGYSMFAAINQEVQLALVRRLHAARGLWSRRIEADLRTHHAPSHCWIVNHPPALGDDLTTRPEGELEAFLRDDHVSRFVWFGTPPAPDLSAVRLTIGLLACTRRAPFYVFFEENGTKPLLVVLDRRAVLDDGDCRRVLMVLTCPAAGGWPVAVTEATVSDVLAGSPADALLRLPARSLLPAGRLHDRRLADDMYYFFRRESVQSSFPHHAPGTRVLVVALPHLAPGPAARAARLLLAQPRLRQRFDRVYVLTFEPADHAPQPIAPLVDGIYHLGHFGLDDRRRIELAGQFLELAEASALLIAHSRHAIELVPAIREAKRPVRITALFDDGADEVYLRRLASEYAALVDRVVCGPPRLTERLLHALYFPTAKLRTLSPADGEAVEWLFPEQAPAADLRESVFGPDPSPRAA